MNDDVSRGIAARLRDTDKSKAHWRYDFLVKRGVKILLVKSCRTPVGFRALCNNRGTLGMQYQFLLSNLAKSHCFRYQGNAILGKA
ncbi:MAG: hypothetical protein LBE22_12925, partial [Azoarcus sp.]|nr:hypothetical protein [Azoarcus sp.]